MSDTKLTKAVIPVAGFGTRWLPYTKAIEKCMVPIGSRPLIDYVVKDCDGAEITDFYFVVGEKHQQLKDYFSPNPELEKHLSEKGKDDAIKAVEGITKANFEYLQQDTAKAYGTAAAVAVAAGKVNRDENVAIIMGDDFVYNADGSSELQKAYELFKATFADAVMMVAEIDRSLVQSYGVIDCHQEGSEVLFKSIVEHPTVEEAPSNLINISKYIVRGDFFDFLKGTMQKPPAKKQGEYLITDTFNDYKNAGKKILIHKITGQFLDGGAPDKWLHANNVIAGA